ncbi:hypothetical protein [Variovorax sp. 38R]|uniref:hypothetical protein n=1 Tax=Variovorax sp. 38R TaxID=2774875 RepID=UPI00177D9041|nr:hypothetical protein [Variovorax sp. 38R]QOF76125.1 hypothetical protein IG196_17140 [Variovorax sp. 38R]
MRSVLLLTIAAALSGGALAQSKQDHAAHHPANVAASAPGASKAPKVPPAQMEMQMKSMQAMHEKMMAAKTPDERQALMDAHMKAMQDGMAMMSQMNAPDGKGGARMSPEMMGKRMDMMEMMMQMMMDRDGMKTPAAK